MNLSTLEVPVEEAKAKVTEYRDLLLTERTAENEALARAYRAATLGKPMIRLTETILAGGLHDDGRPRLAACRATAIRCWVHMASDRIVFTDSDKARAWRLTSAIGDHHLAIRRPQEEGSFRWVRDASTMVPNIPPAARRHLGRNRLGGCHVLWEVEKWEPVPPVDPALIRNVAGDLWIVLATWDLTELERAVLTGTRR